MQNISLDSQMSVTWNFFFYFYLVKQSILWSTQMCNIDNQVFKESIFFYIYIKINTCYFI